MCWFQLVYNFFYFSVITSRISLTHCTQSTKKLQLHDVFEDMQMQSRQKRALQILKFSSCILPALNTFLCVLLFLFKFPTHLYEVLWLQKLGELVHILPAKVSFFSEARTWQFYCDYPFGKKPPAHFTQAYAPRELVYCKEVSGFQARNKELEIYNTATLVCESQVGRQERAEGWAEMKELVNMQINVYTLTTVKLLCVFKEIIYHIKYLCHFLQGCVLLISS